jgi:hypothetical protein
VTAPENGATDPWSPLPPHRETPERPRPRRWVIVLGAVTVFVLGVLGGVVADRYLAVGCRGCPPPAGEGTPLVGTVESAADGVLAVRTPEGRLVVVRAAPDTQVLDERPRAGGAAGLVRGTRVSVLGVRGPDGLVTAVEVGVPG